MNKYFFVNTDIISLFYGIRLNQSFDQEFKPSYIYHVLHVLSISLSVLALQSKIFFLKEEKLEGKKSQDSTLQNIFGSYKKHQSFQNTLCLRTCLNRLSFRIFLTIQWPVGKRWESVRVTCSSRVPSPNILFPSQSPVYTPSPPAGRAAQEEEYVPMLSSSKKTSLSYQHYFQHKSQTQTHTTSYCKEN